MPCEPQSACAGENACTLGYSGIRCADCIQGYYRRAGECEECPDNPLFLVLGFLVAAVLMCFAGYFLNKKHVNLAFVSIGTLGYPPVGSRTPLRLVWLTKWWRVV